MSALVQAKMMIDDVADVIQQHKPDPTLMNIVTVASNHITEATSSLCIIPALPKVNYVEEVVNREANTTIINELKYMKSDDDNTYIKSYPGVQGYVAPILTHLPSITNSVKHALISLAQTTAQENEEIEQQAHLHTMLTLLNLSLKDWTEYVRAYKSADDYFFKQFIAATTKEQIIQSDMISLNYKIIGT